MKYYQFLSSTHTDTYPSMNIATIQLLTQEVSLSTNLVGKWNIPGDTNTSSSTVDIGTFIEAESGLYTFYTNNWDGVEVIAMQIYVSFSPALTGTAFLHTQVLNKMVAFPYVAFTTSNNILQ